MIDMDQCMSLAKKVEFSSGSDEPGIRHGDARGDMTRMVNCFSSLSITKVENFAYLYILRGIKRICIVMSLMIFLFRFFRKNGLQMPVSLLISLRQDSRGVSLKNVHWLNL